jgi:4-aminobutyrate aminotransferase-like enzyme
MLEAKRVADRETLYEKYVNPQWVRLLDVLQMNVEYTRCVGAELQTIDGRRILDFISGYCVHNVGHNHPRVIDALKAELDRNGPAMLRATFRIWPENSPHDYASAPAAASPRPSSIPPEAKESRPCSSSPAHTRGGRVSCTPPAGFTG